MWTNVYELRRTQTLPISMDDCWEFFSNPQNLREITPPWLDFHVLEPAATSVHPGMIIRYYVRPLLGLRMPWMTEITHVVANELFVDEQRFGPYRMWHHQHFFNQVADGIEMQDIVHYVIGYGPLDPFLHRLYVGKAVEAIFDYRYKTLEKLFCRETEAVTA